MNFESFITLRYYLTPVPSPEFRYGTAFLILGALMILAGVLVQVARKQWLKDEILKKVIRRIPRFLKIFGALMILLTLIRQAGIPYLAMRAWWVVYGGLFLYFSLKRIASFKKEYRARQERLRENEREERFSKK